MQVDVAVVMAYEPFREKANKVVYEQVQHKLSCTNTEDG